MDIPDWVPDPLHEGYRGGNGTAHTFLYRHPSQQRLTEAEIVPGWRRSRRVSGTYLLSPAGDEPVIGVALLGRNVAGQAHVFRALAEEELAVILAEPKPESLPNSECTARTKLRQEQGTYEQLRQL